jgi:predicted dehydrogenase
MRQLIEDGAVGDVMNVQHLEPVGWYHFAHSFVRGNWRREDESSFFLMAKACHDVDLITYMLGDLRCTQVSSFGNLQLFKEDKKPAGAAERCLDCPAAVESACPYSAKRLYLTGPLGLENHLDSPADAHWAAKIVDDIEDTGTNWASVTAALKEGPYGRCVFGDCDNDVVDNQVAIMEFEGGASATLSVIACTEDVCIRKTRVMGALGELVGDGDRTIRHCDFRTGAVATHVSDGAPEGTALQGHTGADFYLVDGFVRVSPRPPAHAPRAIRRLAQGAVGRRCGRGTHHTC